MKSNVKELVSRLLEERKDMPSGPFPEAGASPAEGEGAEGYDSVANENGTITYSPAEESDPTEDVVSFLKAFRDACPDCWPAVADAVANDLEDSEEGALPPGEGAPVEDKLPDSPV